DQASLDPRLMHRDDIFFSSYGPDGTLRSAKHATESSTVTASARVLADGSAILLASRSQASLYPEITIPAEAAFFIARYRADGSLAWLKSLTGASDAAPVGTLAVGSDGSIVIGGVLKGTLTLGVGEPKETRLAATLTGAPSGEIFLARLDDSGTLVW